MLERIEAEDSRTTAELRRGEVVEHKATIRIDGRERCFRVFVEANVLSGVDGSLVYGDELVEELFRFEPRALNVLYSTVGKYRRGLETGLPVTLLDSDSERSVASG